jgi:hypothetical protein
MRECCIVANFNGHGLSRDAAVLESLLATLGFNCVRKTRRDLSWLDALASYHNYDLVIFLETVYVRWLFAGRRNCLIPNQEWFKAKKLFWLRFVKAVLCKSLYATEIFEQHIGNKAKYVGFTSEASSSHESSGNEKDFETWLHVAGGSQSKGTRLLLDVWRELKNPPKLIVVQREGNVPKESLPESVTLVTEYLSDFQMIELRHRAGVHICPSESEGFGHNLFQGMLSASVVITTNFPPMNELVGEDRGFLVKVESVKPRRLGHSSFCDRGALAQTIEAVSSMERSELNAIGCRAQHFAKSGTTVFRANFLREIERLME